MKDDTGISRRHLGRAGLAAGLALAAVRESDAALADPNPTQAVVDPQRAEIYRLIDARAGELEQKMILWRRDIHANPELGNRETRTSALVADHLKKLGLEVRTSVAHTGVIGILHGGKPGPVVALRSELDALPVTEQVDIPFASKVRTTYSGQEVGVAHVCGHDSHIAILMGIAEIFSGLRDRLPGTVKFIFQPAEEGAPTGEEGGAGLMLKEGAFADLKPDAIFAVHAGTGAPAGQISYHPGPSSAASDNFAIKIKGKQTHGAFPSAGVDPIVLAAQVVLGLQLIESRQVPVVESPSVLSVTIIKGGIRSNIIPDSVDLAGTLRTFDEAMREDIHARMKRTAQLIAQSGGGDAEITIDRLYPVSVNDPALVAQFVPTLQRVVGAENAKLGNKVLASDDFGIFSHAVPGVMFGLGASPPGSDLSKAAPNHSPNFFLDERAILVGARVLANVAVDFLYDHKA